MDMVGKIAWTSSRWVRGMVWIEYSKSGSSGSRLVTSTSTVEDGDIPGVPSVLRESVCPSIYGRQYRSRVWTRI